MIRFGVFLFLVSCSLNTGLKSVKLDPLFNDNNSKMWMINRELIDDRNIAPFYSVDKKIIVFYASGNVQLSNLKRIGVEKPLSGTYFIDSDEKKLEIIFQQEKLDFDITFLREDKIVLAPTKKSDSQVGWELIPLPEL